MGVVVVDAEIKTQDDKDDGDSVENGFADASAVNAVKAHRDEHHTHKWPVIDDCGGADE